MRKTLFAEGEYYHIYNRGVEKRRIFNIAKDYERFLLNMLAFRSKALIPNLSRIFTVTDQNDQNSVLIKVEKINEYVASKPHLVEIVCFCLMPNHFHFLLKETREGGISAYMQRLGLSYTKYYNLKYSRSGHLFESSFQAIHIHRNEYLMYLSRYIHRNPVELIRNNQPLTNYHWSSYPDFIDRNRWGHGLTPNIILDQFQDIQNYKKYVEENKAIPINIDQAYFID